MAQAWLHARIIQKKQVDGVVCPTNCIISEQAGMHSAEATVT
jgi:hypothetical protein